jgi:hypothetical protein
LRIEVKDVSDNCLLFGERKLLVIWGSFRAEWHSLGAMGKRAAFNVEGSGSSVASELAGLKSFEGKL